MPTLRLLINYIQNYKSPKRTISILCLMLLFWAIYEGIVSYVAPILITNNGISETLMGIIIGSSSIAGALFDFIACRLFKNTYYKRMFLIMFSLCLIYPFILWQANSFVVYIIAMSIWGVYFDLKNIGNFDFVGRHTSKSEHSASFGLIQVFQSIGFLIAPILVGFLIAEEFNYKPLILAGIFLAIAIIFYIFLFFSSNKKINAKLAKPTKIKKTTWSELIIWGKIEKILFPVLFLTLILNFIDAFFWTVGPLFAESLTGVQKFAGFFMTAYSLPALLVGWSVGYFTIRHGKKRTAFFSLLYLIFLSLQFLSLCLGRRLMALTPIILAKPFAMKKKLKAWKIFTLI
ncbi:MAG: MFS transporter [Candidatus Falkowbacteria bacterium]|nr:MFS transporter [Candidatus Falkowbacteria bacterium]